jgi:hypothetical protein
LHAERLQRVFDAFEQVRADDRFNLFHSNCLSFFESRMFAYAEGSAAAAAKDDSL